MKKVMKRAMKRLRKNMPEWVEVYYKSNGIYFNLYVLANGYYIPLTGCELNLREARDRVGKRLSVDGEELYKVMVDEYFENYNLSKKIRKKMTVPLDKYNKIY